MTRLEFLSYVKNEFKRTDKDSEIYEALDDTLYDLTTEHDFHVHQTEQSISLIADTYEYSLTSYSMSMLLGPVLYLDDTGDADPLIKLSKASFDLRFPDLTATDFDKDEPQYYAVYGNAIFIAPFPDTVTTESILVPISTIATKLVGDSDTPAFEDQWREVIKFGVLFRVWTQLGDFGKSQAQDNLLLYQRGIEKMKKIDKSKDRGPLMAMYRGI